MLMLKNGNIVTLDAKQPQVSALVIDQERILAAGDTQQLLADFSGCSEVYDLDGQTVIPGLTDAHIHLAYYALGLQKVDCETSSRQECLQRVAERASKITEGSWVLGQGWNQNEWAEGFGSLADLDAVAPEHPVFLVAKSYHAAWVNSAALRLAGIPLDMCDPQGGQFSRNSRGEIDGILFENAMELVSRVIPEASDEEVAQAFRNAQTRLWSMGLTGAHDFDRRSCFSALQLLHQSGELKLRILKSIPLELLPQAVELGLRAGFGDDRLRIGQVKAFMDGALGPQTAAMFAPYQDTQDKLGMLLMDAEVLFEVGRQAADAGLAMAVHAIGDRANHEALQAFEQLRAYERRCFPGSAPLKHRIEHVQLLHPQDVQRLAELGVAASMQPIHATSDMFTADRYWGERATLSYAWRTQLEHGAQLAFGSDAPVESPNPFWGLHAAITRRRQDGSPGEAGWRPQEKLTLLEALHGFTTGPAQLAGWGERVGRLAPGYYADLLVLEQDLFQTPSQDLWRISPSKTMFGGEWVYEK